MIAAIQLFLAAAVAGAYFTIAALIIPRIELENATPRFAQLFRIGAIAFFLGCGLTHSHIASHAITESSEVELHEIFFHVLQAVGGWIFIVVAIRTLDVKITRRKSEEQLEAELLTARNLELDRSNRELEDFAHLVSHDLRAPLRTISGFTGLLRSRYEGRLDEEADRYLRHTDEATGRMGELLDGLLSYSSAGVAPRLDRVDTAQVLDLTVRSLESRISEAGAAVERGELPVVLGDSSRIGALFQNLIENALKFGGRRIQVDAEPDGDLWRFSVIDDGIGVEPEHADRIFKMFKRLRPKEYEGTGAGLGICSRIVESHGGSIWVEPAVGGGSEFRFTLPATPAGAKLSDPPRGGPEPAPAQA